MAESAGEAEREASGLEGGPLGAIFSALQE
jgi:hypothetical protein